MAYRRWYAHVCGFVGAASDVRAATVANISPRPIRSPRFALTRPANIRSFRFLGEWGLLGLSASMYARKAGRHSPSQPYQPEAAPRLMSFFTLDYSDLAAV